MKELNEKELSQAAGGAGIYVKPSQAADNVAAAAAEAAQEGMLSPNGLFKKSSMNTAKDST